MYQEVFCSNISSSIIKDMEVDPRNKWRKTVSLKLNTSYYWGLMDKLDLSKLWFQKSQIWNSAH